MGKFIPAVAVLAISAFLHADDGPKKHEADTVFREPFTLKLHIDKEHYYEQEVGKVPYVHNGNVYLFRGDEFGLTLDIKDGSVKSVKYQADAKKSDVTLKFTQDVQPDSTAMMVLHIHNNTKHTLDVDALMTVPDRKGVVGTSILPVQPGLSGFESWPHPIVQLVLHNIRITK